ncbi:MAG: LamG domain-containing protein, partial [Bacteroidota bacterium]|nr:LamG domain-containing protein [Bacteroidota bacterium]
SDSIQINADTGFVSYQWSRGDTTATVDLNYSGMYWLTVTDDSSCVEVDSVLVSLINSGLNQSDTTICYGDSISLTSWHQSENISSVYFDGDSSSISFSDAGFPTANSERSFEAWVYNAGQSGKNCLFSYGDQITGNVFSVFLDQYDSLSVQLNSDEYLCTQLIPQNSWTHIMVGTDPSNKYTFYVNGIFANSNFITGTYNTQLSGTAWIGRSSDTLNPAWFDGRIDEVRIWDRIISGGEVVDNMSFHTNTNSDNHLLRFFDFNHFTGNFSNDIYGYPAQLNLATTSNSIPFSAYTFRFLWSNGSTNPQTNITYFDSEITNLEISDDVNSCNHDLNVTVVPLPNLSDSIFLCNENQYELSTNFNYGSYQWNTGNNTSSIFVTNTGDYSLTVSDAACTYIDSVFISMISVEILNSDTAICDGESITLEAISSTATYHWSDDTQNPSITISPVSSAIYYVSASDGYNTCSDQVSVTVFPVYDPGLDDTLLLCNESYGLLNANNTYFDSFQWSNGDTTNFSVVTQTGMYQLTASDINGCTTIDQSYVQLMFTDIIENDTLLCNGLSFDLNVVSSGSNFVWSTGETTSVITVSNSGQYSVTQTSGTFTCPDTVNIYFSPEIILSLPDTLSSCEAEIFTLNAGSLPYDYEWNTGAIIPEIQVQTSGLYSVTATNQDGCEASDTTLVSIIDVVMSISDTLVCEGSEVIV